MRNFALAASLSLFAAAPALADKNGSLSDVIPPTFQFHMIDGADAGPIAWHRSQLLPSLGCRGMYGDGDWDHGWNARFPGTNFRDPAIQMQSYFFNQDAPGEPYSFYVTAQDNRAVKRIHIIIEEREVYWLSGEPWPTRYDGPSDYSNYFPTHAVPTLVSVWDGQGANPFDRWEKRLSVESSWLVFDVADFGRTGRIDVVVEDFAGNVAVGGVYLVWDEICIVPGTP